MAGLGSYDYGDASIRESLQGKKMKQKAMKGMPKTPAKFKGGTKKIMGMTKPINLTNQLKKGTK